MNKNVTVENIINDYIGGEIIMNMTKNEFIYPTGCSMTQWNEDCEEITNQVERILNEYNLYDHDRNTNVANSNQLVTVLEILKKIK